MVEILSYSIYSVLLIVNNLIFIYLKVTFGVLDLGLSSKLPFSIKFSNSKVLFTLFSGVSGGGCGTNDGCGKIISYIL